MKTKGFSKLDSFYHIPWHRSTKAGKYSSRYLLSLSEQLVYFHETDYCINLSHYLFFKIGVLKTIYTIQRKTAVSESPPFNQPVAYYFIDKRLRHRRFLVDIAKLSRTPFLQEHLETPDSVFMEHICNCNIKVFFPTICWDTHKYWNVMWNYSFLSSHSEKFVIKCG